MKSCAMVGSPSMGKDLNFDQIKKLWTLDLIVASGSLKKAALRAKVSPSAISQSLTSLERSIGKRLVIRERGSIVATQDALALLQAVRPAFEVFERINHDEPVPHIAWMNFGTYESIAIDVLPGLIHQLKERLPNLRLNLRISRSPVLMTLVRKGELCTALITEMDDLDRFYVKDLITDRMGVYLSAKHPIAQMGWKAIEKIGVGVLSPGPTGYPRYMSRYLRRLDLGKPFLTSDSFEALRMAAQSGTIAAILPSRVAGRADDLVELIASKQKDGDSGKHRICLISPSNCDPAETDFLADVIGKIMQR